LSLPWTTIALVDKKVVDLFLINLQITASYQEFHTVVFLVYKTKYLLKAFGNNSCLVRIRGYSEHGVCLSTSCLAISKDCTIVPLDYRFNQWECTFIINGLLLCIRIIYLIKSEIFLRITCIIYLENSYLICGFVHFENCFAISFLFRFIHRSHSDHNFNCFSRLSFRHLFSLIIK
jgi:hypothetical protein